MKGLIVFEMSKDYKCISKSLYLSIFEVHHDYACESCWQDNYSR